MKLIDRTVRQIAIKLSKHPQLILE